MISGLPITETLLKQLKSKLDVGNLRAIQLNCVPGRTLSRMDLCDLKSVDEEIPKAFLDKLFNHSQKFDFEVSFDAINLNLEDEEDSQRQKELGVISKRLNHLFFQNKEDFQEYGYESFGFGFPLVVFRPQNSPEKLIRAPLFIWRLSIHKNLSQPNSWTLSRKLDQEIQYNDLLRSYVGEVEGFQIEGFTDKELDDSVLDYDEILQNTVEFIRKFSSADKKSELTTALQGKFDKGLKEIPKNKKLKETAGSIPKVYWAGVFGRFSQRNEAIRKEVREDLLELIKEREDNEEDEIVTVNSFGHSETAVPTDPSQLGILNFLKHNKHAVIQGPPGTGKSQTITGILLNAMEQGKRTLVICEKKTAMEVLKENLKEVDPNVGELAAVIEDVSRDRRALVDSVRDRYDNFSYRGISGFNSDSISLKLAQVEDKINDIHRKKKFFHTKEVVQGRDDLNWHRSVGEFLNAKHKNGNNSIRRVLEKEQIDISKLDFNEVLIRLEKIKHASKTVNDEDNLHFVKDEHILDNQRPFELRTQLQDLFDSNIEELELFADNYQKHLEETKEYLYDQIDQVLKVIDQTLKELSEVNNKLSEQKLLDKKNWWYSVVHLVGKISDNVKQKVETFDKPPELIGEVQKNLSQLKVEVNSDFELSLKGYASKADQIQKDVKEIKRRLSHVKQELLNKLFDESILNIQLDQEIISDLSKRIAQLKRIKESDLFTESVDKIKTTDLNHLVQDLSLLKDYTRKFNQADQNNFFDHIEWQVEYRSLSEELKKIVSKLQENGVADWENHFKEFFLNEKLKDAFDFKKSGDYESELESLMNLRDDLRDEIKERIPKIWRAKQADINGKVNIPKLYNKRGSKGQRRNSLRKIVQRSLESLTSYFPVLMINPSACAAMLPLEPELFDLVIYDEASQLKVEESLSTLIRGERKVISGDKHQMPPSYWFSSVSTDEITIDEEEEVEYDNIQEELESREGARELADSESLLEFAELCEFNSYNLDFHYRSYHPLLIEFSNAAFYKSRLYPLPERINEPPIQFFQINGSYQNQKNEAEADAAIEILKQLKRDRDGELPSVGIATFNLQQRNFIWDLIKREIQISDDFKKKFEELEQNGFFVKNLENIQGDERDVIILSTTFGVKPDGRFIQNYGPINRKNHGRRLLNVIVTRARKKVFVLTSIPSSICRNYREELGGSNVKERGYLHAYLSYAKSVSNKDKQGVESVRSFFRDNTQVLNRDINLTESPFEEAVYQALCSEFDPDRIITQHWAGGFRIDMVVLSKKTNRPFIAIECDGATYHGSLEDYAWDLHRQNLLEKHGFTFHRIWSRDWWESSERELKDLIDFIHQQDENDEGRAVFDEPTAEHISLGNEFFNRKQNEDSLEEKEQVDVESSQVNKSSLKENIQTELEGLKPNGKPTLFDEPEKDLRAPTIDVGNVVNIKFLEDGKERTIKLAKNRSSVKETDDFIVIDEKSPMGNAILGKKVGDTFEIGNLEKYCKVLAIN